MLNLGNKTILVTGGAGYIGSHACKALSRAGYLPVCYDNLSRGHENSAQWGPLEVGDILDRNRLEEVFKKYQPLAVMHFAAFAYVGESVSKPRMYYRNNVMGTISLIESMLEHNVKRFIFSSTCAVYGIPEVVPIVEDHPVNPINPYGNTKAIIEIFLRDLNANDEINYVSLRYFNAAGADLDCETGEEHEPETHLIPLVLQTAAGKRSHVEIYGDDYPTPDGTCIRDYIHVNDLADSHVRALEYILQDGQSTIFNLGTETAYSVKEILQRAEFITGNTIESRKTDRRKGDPPALLANASRIKSVLGWQASYSDLDTILSSAWAWQQRNE